MENLEEERLRAEYSPKSETKVDKALKIERKMKLPAYIFTYSYGLIGALILGVGMCLAMEVIANGLVAIVSGIIIGLIGIAIISTNYPLFKHVMRKRKDKYASRILVTLNSEN